MGSDTFLGLSPGALGGFGGLLSGIGGLVSATKDSVTPVRNVISDIQKPSLESLFRRAGDVTQGNSVAGFDPLQTRGQNAALNAAGSFNPLIRGSQSANQFLLGDVLNPSSNPFLQASATAATRPIFEGLTQNILPSIRNQAASTGNVGSSRQGIAEGLAIQGAQRAAGDTSTNIFSQAYGQGLNALVSGLQQAPNTAQFGLLPSQIQQQIGAQRQGLDQQQLLDPFNQASRFQSLIGNPILVGAEGPGGGGGGGSLLGDFLNDPLGAVRDVGGAVTEGVTNIVDPIAAPIAEEAADTFLPVISPIADAVNETLSSGFFEDIGTGITDSLGAIEDGSLSDFVGGIGGIAEGLTSPITDPLDKAGEELGGVLGGFSPGDIAGDALGTVGDALGGFGSGFGGGMSTGPGVPTLSDVIDPDSGNRIGRGEITGLTGPIPQIGGATPNISFAPINAPVLTQEERMQQLREALMDPNRARVLFERLFA